MLRLYRAVVCACCLEARHRTLKQKLKVGCRNQNEHMVSLHAIHMYFSNISLRCCTHLHCFIAGALQLRCPAACLTAAASQLCALYVFCLLQVRVRHPALLALFAKHADSKGKQAKLKSPAQLQELLDICRSTLAVGIRAAWFMSFRVQGCYYQL